MPHSPNARTPGVSISSSPGPGRSSSAAVVVCRPLPVSSFTSPCSSSWPRREHGRAACSCPRPSGPTNSARRPRHGLAQRVDAQARDAARRRCPRRRRARSRASSAAVSSALPRSVLLSASSAGMPARSRLRQHAVHEPVLEVGAVQRRPRSRPGRGSRRPPAPRRARRSRGARTRCAAARPRSISARSRLPLQRHAVADDDGVAERLALAHHACRAPWPRACRRRRRTARTPPKSTRRTVASRGRAAAARPRPRGRRRARLSASAPGPRSGSTMVKLRALAGRALDRDAAAVVLDRAVRRGQAEAVALRLGREHELEHARQVLGADARPGVPRPRSRAARARGVQLGAHADRAAGLLLAHRVGGVDEQVDEHALDLADVGLELAAVCGSRSTSHSTARKRLSPFTSSIVPSSTPFRSIGSTLTWLRV